MLYTTENIAPAGPLLALFLAQFIRKYIEIAVGSGYTNTNATNWATVRMW